MEMKRYLEIPKRVLEYGVVLPIATVVGASEFFMEEIAPPLAAVGTTVLIVGGVFGIGYIACNGIPEGREEYRELRQPRFEDVNGDSIPDKIIGDETFYGVDLPNGRRIYLPKDQFDEGM